MTGRALITAEGCARSGRVSGVVALVLALLSPGILAACAGGGIELEQLQPTTTSTIAPTASTSTTTTIPREGSVSGPADPDAVDLAIARLTLEQKVGQLIMAAVWGTDAVAVRPTDVAPNQAIRRANTQARCSSRSTTWCAPPTIAATSCTRST